MYARTNRCYKERDSRTNYFRCSIPHCISMASISLGGNVETNFMKCGFNEQRNRDSRQTTRRILALINY